MNKRSKEARSGASASITLFDNEKSRSDPQKTFPIFGLPRGGTTSVAGCVRKLGIFIGDKLPANLEDPEFSRRKKVLPDIVHARNADHDVWGWKFPLGASYLDSLMRALRNPRLIMVTRDLTANGLGISDRQSNFSQLRALETVMMNTLSNHALVMRLRRPTLLISYEKLLMKPDQAVEEIAQFLCLDASEALLAEAKSFVQPGRYRAVSDSASEQTVP